MSIGSTLPYKRSARKDTSSTGSLVLDQHRASAIARHGEDEAARRELRKDRAEPTKAARANPKTHMG